ncbi:MAG: Flp pilus assembly complex ATPase component TadA [Planctomycetes bacterium]|nr:Flp pilus assembly complex ATPase component TadA [Planctomycetota bacterium]
MAKKRIGQILIEMGYVTQAEVDAGLAEQKKGGGGKKLGELLVEAKACDEEQVAKAIAHQHSLKYCQISKFSVPPDVVAAVAKDVATEVTIMPLKKGKRSLVVAAENPLDFFQLDNLRFRLGVEVEAVIASRMEILAAINKYYGETLGLEEAMEGMGEEIALKRDLQEDVDEADGDDAPIIRLVNQIIAEAVKKRASDIHVEPMERKVRLRYRIDGDCIEQEPIPKKLQGALLSRLKIMAKMKPEEKRTPQDGRIKLRLAGRDIDFRVNSLPATHGESIVLRILDKESALVDLEILGLHSTDFEKFNRIIKRPNGIFLVTGPTGSGKTTTLYAALKKLNKPDVKIITAENPVEYNLEGINQAEVNHEIGRTFSVILKAMLRQAPNVILVGEIRDEETATVGIQAALTGHLVFSTLHTNDAPSSISRLTDMGVKPFLVASAVLAILAQRLLRRLCPKCKEPIEVRDLPEWQLASVGLKPEQVRGKQLYGPVGCDNCNGAGYRGRLGVYELLEMGPQVRELAFNEAHTTEIRKAAIQNGMSSLQVDGVRKVLDGLTTIDEVLVITHRQDLKLA